ncbi:MAG: DUF1003 domain-containing protein [Gaiellaceae bacterium]
MNDPATGELAALDPLRHLNSRDHARGAFGDDPFGKAAETGARFFGTPGYILGQTVVVIVWISINAIALALRWDPYPFILLNLAFSLQAAYAAPLILLAQTRQAERDKMHVEADAMHREEIAGRQAELLEVNTKLTEQVHQLTLEIHRTTCIPTGEA